MEKIKITTEWFKHEVNALENPKLIKVLQTLGYKGIGIYWTLVEIFYARGGIIKDDELDALLWNARIETKDFKTVAELAFVYDAKCKVWYIPRIREQLESRLDLSEKAQKAAFARHNKNKSYPPKEKPDKTLQADWYDEHDKELKEDSVKKTKANENLIKEIIKEQKEKAKGNKKDDKTEMW